MNKSFFFRLLFLIFLNYISLFNSRGITILQKILQNMNDPILPLTKINLFYKTYGKLILEFLIKPEIKCRQSSG